MYVQHFLFYLNLVTNFSFHVSFGYYILSMVVYYACVDGMILYDLTSIPNPTLRNCLTRFRLGSHWLEVETGRWQGKQREDRTCETCLKMGRAQVEDEEHMVKTCPLYEEVRHEFVDLEFDRNVEEIV